MSDRGEGDATETVGGTTLSTEGNDADGATFDDVIGRDSDHLEGEQTKGLIPRKEQPPASTGDSRDDECQLLRTGVADIDQVLGGGLPKGAITIVEGSSESAGRQLLYDMVVDQKPVFYYTGLHSEQVVHRELEQRKYISSNLRTITDFVNTDLPTLTQQIQKDITPRDGPATVVLDPITDIEQQYGYTDTKQLLRAFEQALGEDMVGLIYRVSTECSLRSRWVVREMADCILDIEHNADGRTANRLSVSKSHSEQKIQQDRSTREIIVEDGTTQIESCRSVSMGK